MVAGKASCAFVQTVIHVQKHRVDDCQ